MLDILQHIQALDPSQHGAVGYLVQHTLEHIQHKKHAVAPEIKRRSAPEHLEVQYSVGLVMKHKRWITLEKRKPHIQLIVLFFKFENVFGRPGLHTQCLCCLCSQVGL